MPDRPKLPFRAAPTETLPSALSGVSVVDFSRVLAGPFATQILGDHGAEIVKVEQIGVGDDTRRLIPQPSLGGESFFYLALNRNKKSISLDLASEEGRQVALDLIATADVVVENFTTKVMQRFGLDFGSLKERFPKLIYCSISAYGRTGRLANAGGYDSAISFESGLSALNTLPGQSPVTMGAPFVDITTGQNAVIGILMALRARDATGKGQFIESVMFDTAVADLTYRGYQFLVSGDNPSPMGKKPKFGVPGGQFDCRDGMMWFSCTGDKMWRTLCEKVVNRPELLEDPRYTTDASRHEHFDPLYDTLAEIFVVEDRGHWSTLLKSHGIPCGEVRAVNEALTSAETTERGMVYEIDHPTAGRVPMISAPIRMSETPARHPTPPPLLGEHTRELLRGVAGYDAARIEALIKRGVVQTTDKDARLAHSHPERHVA